MNEKNTKDQSFNSPSKPIILSSSTEIQYSKDQDNSKKFSQDLQEDPFEQTTDDLGVDLNEFEEDVDPFGSEEVDESQNRIYDSIGQSQKKRTNDMPNKRPSKKQKINDDDDDTEAFFTVLWASKPIQSAHIKPGKETKKGITYYYGFRLNGKPIFVGDDIYLSPDGKLHSDPADYWKCHITSLFERDGEKWCRARWWYSIADVVPSERRKLGKSHHKELYFSSKQDDNLLSTVVGQCTILQKEEITEDFEDYTSDKDNYFWKVRIS